MKSRWSSTKGKIQDIDSKYEISKKAQNLYSGLKGALGYNDNNTNTNATSTNTENK